jgi:betaine-aldehyde dehydrogenase
MQIRDKLYIDGRWTAASGKKTLDVISASTEEVMGRIPEGDYADVQAAVAAARRAFDGWAATPVAERAAFLKKIQEGLKARADDIARTISGEVGMPLKLSAMIQAGSPIGTFGMYARMLGDFAFEEKVGHSLVVREPVGVVAAITPWNYPLHQIAAKVAPALAAGCTVVLKPSEVAPLNAFILADVIDAAGLPAGVFNLVTGYGQVVGEALVTHPEVDMVSFTGSTRAGKRVSELAAQTVKRVALELGGKSAAVILDDADLAAAVRGTVNACFLNSGQTCTAHTRMLVPESRYAEAAKLAAEAAAKFTVGDPFAETSKLGPVISAAQRDRVQDFIRKGIAEGAELLCGGPDAPAGLTKGYYVQPTVFGRVKPGSAIEQEEIFGPVLSIVTYRDEDEAARIANGTPYGLAGAVWAGSDARAIAFARRLRTGQVDINGGAFNALAPFGGFKQSGNGRELGKYGLEEFLEYKALQFKLAPK